LPARPRRAGHGRPRPGRRLPVGLRPRPRRSHRRDRHPLARVRV
ncbi:MAG: hypothetical protein AVDCRST_MAG30-2879, partial [uncultured Solirubrobacteraceae bacterium]